MNKQAVKPHAKPPLKKYSLAFKRKIVQEYEGGLLNKDRLALKYGIKGNSTVLKWCRQYGRLAYPIDSPTQMGRPLKDPQKQRIKELEQALANALAQVKAYQTLIQLTEQEEGISILKKDGIKSSSG